MKSKTLRHPVSNERLEALVILLEVFQQGKPLDWLFQSRKNVSSLTKAICYDLCRHYFQLEHIAAHLVPKRPKEQDLWLLILLGLYQLHFLNKPDYATVKETVDLVAAIKKPWARGLINAVLRRFCRERLTLIPLFEAQKHFQTNHPDWFITQLQSDWPDYWTDILSANDTKAPMSLRVNLKRLSRNSYLEALAHAGKIATEIAYTDAGIMLDVACDVDELPGFKQGDVSVQDQSAQLAVSLLNLAPGLRVLDVCAAPGGKTCHILETEPALAACVALDIQAKRMQRVKENLIRLQLKDQVTLQVGDGIKTDDWWDGALFDRILLDAPCSASGVIRRHPDIKIHRTEADVQAACEIQAKLLDAVWPLLQSGGMMIYATCSVLKQENEQQIANFVANHPDDCTVISNDMPWGLNTGFGWQLFPGDNHGDGFFYSVLIRK